jgi:hypothetical protein
MTAIAHIGEVVGVVGEIVAGADFQVITDVPVAAEQESQPVISGFANLQPPQFDQGVPLSRE